MIPHDSKSDLPLAKPDFFKWVIKLLVGFECYRYRFDSLVIDVMEKWIHIDRCKNQDFKFDSLGNKNLANDDKVYQ